MFHFDISLWYNPTMRANQPYWQNYWYDLRGELQVLVYKEPAPGPHIEPVMVRTVMLGRR